MKTACGRVCRARHRQPLQSKGVRVSVRSGCAKASRDTKRIKSAWEARRVQNVRVSSGFCVKLFGHSYGK